MTTSAPHAVASARRAGEKSLATTWRTPFAFSIRITPRPIGPQPITTATVLLLDLAASNRVPCDRHRLGQRGDIGGEAVGHRHHQRLLDQQLLGVGARRVDGESEGVDPLASAQQRNRDHRRSRRRVLALHPGPCSATWPQNSWPKTISWSERAKRS